MGWGEGGRASLENARNRGDGVASDFGRRLFN